jgi:hypothetical protein
MGEWRYSSVILDLGARWRWVVGSRPGRLIRGEIVPDTDWIGGYMWNLINIYHGMWIYLYIWGFFLFLFNSRTLNTPYRPVQYTRVWKRCHLVVITSQQRLISQKIVHFVSIALKTSAVVDPFGACVVSLVNWMKKWIETSLRFM